MPHVDIPDLLRQPALHLVDEMQVHARRRLALEGLAIRRQVRRIPGIDGNRVFCQLLGRGHHAVAVHQAFRKADFLLQIRLFFGRGENFVDISFENLRGL